MWKRAVVSIILISTSAASGCESVLGIDEHQLAAVDNSGAASVMAGTGGSGASDRETDTGGNVTAAGTGGVGPDAEEGGSSGSGATPNSSDAGGEAGAGHVACVEDSGRCTPGCTAGAIMEMGPCGNCGTSVATCGNDGTWGAPACTKEGECAPTATASAACGNCGTQTRTCDATCHWGAYGTCGSGACSPGATDTQACGNCGSHTRTCGATCNWGTFGACTGTGVCAPGQSDAQACGNCGTQTRTCSASCAWGTFGACSGSGACSPGQTSAQGCGSCGGMQTRTCSASCAWGGFAGCSVSTPSNFGASCNCGDGTIQCDGSCNAACPTISIVTAREGCLDIQPAGNMTAPVASMCNGKTSCAFQPYTDSQIPAPHSTRSFCSQGMEITYTCTYRSGSKVATVPGDAWDHGPAQLSCP